MLTISHDSRGNNIEIAIHFIIIKIKTLNQYHQVILNY